MVAVSRMFKSKPMGGGWQPVFHNAAVVVRTTRSPRELLQIAKTIEREAGRRPGRRWGPRALDIDIIDYAGLLLPEHPSCLPSGPSLTPLTLPHPRVHLRAFALIPIAEIMPHWRHTRLGRSVWQLLRDLPRAELRSVVPLVTGEGVQGA